MPFIREFRNIKKNRSLLNSLEPMTGWIFRKLNISKPNYLTGCLRSFPLPLLIIFGFITDMLAVKSSPRNAVGLVRKYFRHFVYSLHSLSCLGTAVSECSTTAHSGTKTFIMSDVSRLIPWNKSVFLFKQCNLDKKKIVAKICVCPI